MDADVLRAGEFRMPLDSRLASLIASEVYNVIWDIHASGSARLSFLLMARNRIASAIGIAVSAWAMACEVRNSPMPGWSIKGEEPTLDYFARVIDSPSQVGFFRHLSIDVALLAQSVMLRILDAVGIRRPVFLASNDEIEPKFPRKWFWRIRGFTGLFGRPARLSSENKEVIASLADTVLKDLQPRLAGLGVVLTKSALTNTRRFLLSELETAYADWRNIQRWFGGRAFDFFGGTVCNYGRALLAFAARQSGGVAHSTVHGGNVYGNTFEPNLMELFNASVAWVPSEQAADNARDIYRQRYPNMPAAAIEVHSRNALMDYDRGGTVPQVSRRIIVFGAPVVLEVSAIGALQAPCYVDAERRVCALLAAEGFDVIYKPHPENNWRFHHLLFDKRVRIEARPYEQVKADADTVIYIFHISSTLITDLGSNRRIFLLADGWHETFWLESVWSALRRRCEIMPGEIDAAGRIQFDADTLLKKLKGPFRIDKAGFFDFIGGGPKR